MREQKKEQFKAPEAKSSGKSDRIIVFVVATIIGIISLYMMFGGNRSTVGEKTGCYLGLKEE